MGKEKEKPEDNDSSNKATCNVCKGPIELPAEHKNPEIVPEHDFQGNPCKGSGCFSVEAIKAFSFDEKEHFESQEEKALSAHRCTRR